MAEPDMETPDMEIGSLPDNLLCLVLEKVWQHERLTRVCLVCKHWHALCHSAPVLRRATIHISPPHRMCERYRNNWKPITDWVLRRLVSAQLWLHKYGASITTLSVSLILPTGDFGYLPPPTPRHRASMLKAAQRCVATCATAGRLEALSFSVPQLAPVSLDFDQATAAQLTGLTSLELVQPGGDLSVLSSLSKLRSAELVAVWEVAAFQLPTGLTSLKLSVQESFLLPDVGLSSLTALERLELEGRRNPDWSTPLPTTVCIALPALTSLRQLILSGFDELPAELGQALAALRSLRVLRLCELDAWHPDSPPPKAARAGLLQQLRQGMLGALAALSSHLTGLVLYEVTFLAHPPQGLSALTNLQALQVASSTWASGGSAPSLPPGPWLAGLSQLSLDWKVMKGSWEALAPEATPKLRRLLVMFMNREERRKPTAVPGLKAFWRRLWEWVGTHPALQKVDFEEVETDPEEVGMHGPHPEVEQMYEQMGERYPHLQIADEFVSCSDFYEDMERGGRAGRRAES